MVVVDGPCLQFVWPIPVSWICFEKKNRSSPKEISSRFSYSLTGTNLSLSIGRVVEIRSQQIALKMIEPIFSFVEKTIIVSRSSRAERTVSNHRISGRILFVEPNVEFWSKRKIENFQRSTTKLFFASFHLVTNGFDIDSTSFANNSVRIWDFSIDRNSNDKFLWVLEVWKWNEILLHRWSFRHFRWEILLEKKKLENRPDSRFSSFYPWSVVRFSFVRLPFEFDRCPISFDWRVEQVRRIVSSSRRPFLCFPDKFDLNWRRAFAETLRKRRFSLPECWTRKRSFLQSNLCDTS